MNLNQGIFRWRRVLRLWLAGFLVLALRSIAGDALENWTSHTFPDVTLTACSSGQTHAVPIMGKVVFHRGLFVAAGTGPCYQDTPTVILSSADGLNWARSTNQGINGFWGVMVAADVIVAVGFWGQTELSSDGINWALNFYQPPGSIFPVNLNAVTYGLGRFVAVGDFVATSTNGLNWTAGTVFPAVGGFVAAASGDGVFWAATPSRLCRSITGTNFFNILSGAGERILCFGNHRFLAVGTSLKVSTNVNGWEPTPWPTASPFDTLTFGAGMFVATSGRDVATSLDGFNWIVRTNALGGRALDVTFGNGMFMAVARTNYYTSSPVAALQPASSPGTLWLHGVKSRDYEIVATNDLSASNWPVLARITLTNSPQSWTDANPPATNGQRFYRSNLAP